MGALVSLELVVVTLIVALLSVGARAQAGTSTIAGLVRDSSGGAVPGAIIRIVNEGTGVALEEVSNEQGVYRAAGLAAGRYRLETVLDGFETAVRRIVLEAGQEATNDVTLSPARFSQSVVVTARRVEELAQEVPIPVSVVRGDLVADAGAFNVNRLKEMIPTVQFYSTNRGIRRSTSAPGRPFGLTNDGIEPGVGLYIDGVFYRPASATLDFLDVDRVEVLRGPQGDAVRQEHDRRRHQRHDPEAQLHARRRIRAQLRRRWIRPGESIDHGPSPQEVRRAAVLLGDPT
jgi:iron complex outermembrane receptor protein